MAHYVDGYIIPIKKKKVNAYKKMATMGCKLWMKHGALDYYECIGDDLNVKYGLPFSKVWKLKSDETVVFAFIVYKSKAHRNKVNKKVHSDPSMQMEGFVMPFDPNRFSMGGFKTLVRAK